MTEKPAKAEGAKLEKLCFVVGPIGKLGSEERRHADWLFQGIIQPVFKEHFSDTRVERSDKMSVPGMIDSQMINMLLDCDLVIADMSKLNANAFYEIGIRHMAQKPIIHMFLEGETIPFDVAPYRAISFSLNHPDDLAKAGAALKAAVDIVRTPGYTVENPVTRARGQLQLEQHATPEIRLLMDEVRELKARVGTFTGRRTAPSRDLFADQALPVEQNWRFTIVGETSDHTLQHGTLVTAISNVLDDMKVAPREISTDETTPDHLALRFTADPKTAREFFRRLGNAEGVARVTLDW